MPSPRIIKCAFCNKIITRKESQTNYNKSKHHFCSHICHGKFKDKRQMVVCKNCGKSFLKRRLEIKKSKNNNFCSLHCAGVYNNAHKTIGNRRSKLEIWLESKLKELYPNEKILFNDKTAINSELDIYFPNRKLAFELNGIFHYEPIFGEKKLEQTKNSDQRKFLLCHQNNISLCVIDVSKEKYFKVERSKKYLDIVQKILEG